MPIRPVDPHRIAAYQLHPLNRDVGLNRRGVENPLARPFVDAVGTFTLAPEKNERKMGLLTAPADGQDALVAIRLEIGRHHIASLSKTGPKRGLQRIKAGRLGALPRHLAAEQKYDYTSLLAK